MIFQEPMTSLNPVLTIGEQITEVLIYHKKLSKKEAAKKAVELLKLVGFSRAGEPDERVSAPPVGRHEAEGHDRHCLKLQSEAADRG